MYLDNDAVFIILLLYTITVGLKQTNQIFLKCRLSALIQGGSQKYCINHLEFNTIFMHSPSFSVAQNYLDNRQLIRSSVACSPIISLQIKQIKDLEWIPSVDIAFGSSSRELLICSTRMYRC